jgi:hypothetical protein
MNELVVATDRASDWSRLKALVLDSVSSPITKRVYNLGLDEFIAWYIQEPHGGFTKATVAAWRVHLESRGLAPFGSGIADSETFAAARQSLVHRRSARKAWAHPYRANADLGEERN